MSYRRGGLGNRLKGWFGQRSKSTYGLESIEARIRFLADLAFLFQDYEVAYSNYKLVLQDYKADDQHERSGSAFVFFLFFSLFFFSFFFRIFVGKKNFLTLSFSCRVDGLQEMMGLCTALLRSDRRDSDKHVQTLRNSIIRPGRMPIARCELLCGKRIAIA